MLPLKPLAQMLDNRTPKYPNPVPMLAVGGLETSETTDSGADKTMKRFPNKMLGRKKKDEVERT